MTDLSSSSASFRSCIRRLSRALMLSRMCCTGKGLRSIKIRVLAKFLKRLQAQIHQTPEAKEQVDGKIQSIGNKIGNQNNCLESQLFEQLTLLLIVLCFLFLGPLIGDSPPPPPIRPSRLVMPEDIR